MSCTAISTFLEYNTPDATLHCGLIYCSQNFEYFIIHCNTCSQEFNLLSCNLFIKHVKECYSVIQDRSQNQEISNYAIENLLKDAFKNNAADGDVAIGDEQMEPLLALKVEIGKDKDDKNSYLSSDQLQCVVSPSDYEAEECLSVDQVIHRRMVEGIIDEYKRHSLLWKSIPNESSNEEAVNNSYHQIRLAVNTKFKTNFTDSELRSQICNLCSEYRKVSEKKKEYDANCIQGSTPYDTKLWYFEKLSFINEIHEDAKNPVDETDESRIPKIEISDDDESSDSTNDKTQHGPKKPKKERPYSKVLSESPVITDIISQYKKYPFLWDQTASLYNDKYARKDAFRKITSLINKKFHKTVTDKDVRRQIVNLRSAYRRAQRKKHRADYRVSLWYYDDLSFIDGRSDQLDEDGQVQDGSASKVASDDDNSQSLGETFKNKIAEPSDDDNNDNNDFNDNVDEDDDDDDDDNEESGENLSCRRKSDKKIVLALIEEYKRHPCLWNNYLYKTSSRFDRVDANKEITCAINAKFKKNFTELEIRNKLVQLRSGYRRVLRKKEAFEKKHASAKRKFHSELWYFDKMAFIGQTENDFPVTRKKKVKPNNKNTKKVIEEEEEEDEDDDEDEDEDDEECTPLDDQSEGDSNVGTDTLQENNMDAEEDQSDEEEEPKTKKKSKTLTKNRELLTAIIDEYKKLPCLWAVQYYSNDNSNRRKAFKKMASNVNAKFNTQFTFKDLRREISKLRGTYKRTMRRKLECKDGEFKTKMWYVELLSFIEKTPGDIKDELDMDTSQNEAFGGDKVYKEESKENIFEIIEQFKSEPILWDNKHYQHLMWSERRKAIERIIAKLSQEHNCHLTVEEFRYQLRFLKESYFRAVRDDVAIKQGNLNTKHAPKPFFFDKMSFLEPFADKNPSSGKQMYAETDSSEDFTFLSENRPLMMQFIEMYKAQGCLWDEQDTERDNQAAQSDAYDKIINMFLKNDVIFTKEQVMSAIGYLYSTVVNTQKRLESADKSDAKEPIWFYERLKFLGNIPRDNDLHCSHCDQYFHTLAAYQKHKKEINKDYPYKCATCNAGFMSRSKYAFHQITHKEPHKCEQCGFQTFDRYNFNIHMRRHKGIHAFRCEYCDKGFVTSTELNRHLRMHTGHKPFICDICGKQLPSNSDFQQHLKRHRNQRDHKCEFCGSAFFTLTTLRDHMASHSTERQHVCEVCGASFKRKKTLHQHKSLHMERKKHECKICGKTFAQQAGVYSHMKSHGMLE